jgi:hypothetical protein
MDPGFTTEAVDNLIFGRGVGVISLVFDISYAPFALFVFLVPEPG